MRFKARTIGKVKISPDEFVVLDHVRLRGDDYSGRKLKQFCTIGCHLEGCRFDQTRIVDAQFGAGREPSEFVECIFDGSRMLHVSGGPSRFVRCAFRNVDLRDWIAFEVELVDCIFSGCLTRAVFNGSVRPENRTLLGRNLNEFHGNDFSGMEFIDVGFRTGVDLSQQRLPSGSDYLYLPDAASAVQRARSKLLGWNNLKARRNAFIIVKCLEQKLQEGQKQMFLRQSDNYDVFPRESVDAVFALLRGKSIKLN